MRFFLLLAWRNLWRNKRRTLLAVTSVFFAVFLTLLFSAVNYGQDDDTMRVSVSMSTGYLQVQGRGYWDERSLDHSIELPQRLLANLGAIPAVTTTVPRLETVALVSRGQETRIAPVIGIVPGSESDMTGVRRLVVSGSYLSDSSRGVLIAEGLAELVSKSDRERDEMGESALTLVQRSFSWDTIVQNMYSVYLWLLKKDRIPDCVHII